MYKVNNLIENPNVKVISELGPVRIIEHQRNMNVSNLSSMSTLYYFSKMNIHYRQALITLNQSSFMISSGAMQWMLGDVSLSSNVKGAADYISKIVSGKMTGESAIKPLYYGTGLLMLEPTLKPMFMLRVEEWGGIMLNDGAFLGCEGSVTLRVKTEKSLGTAMTSGQGFFHLSCEGEGVVLLESPVPIEHLVEVELQDDALRVDGNFAVAWSSSLQFTSEFATKKAEKTNSGAFGFLKNAIESNTTGEGLVNAFRGTGKVLLAVV
ncbi:MAG: AIM24 family protein [bacterium]|nr:AIM24 family protein [bacterium]